MLEALPFFKYYPNPIETGNFKLSDKICACREKARGYIYTASVYSTHDLHESICPWRIADGSAAEKFSADFNDCVNLPNVSDEILTEILEKTPGYESRQGNIRTYHCNDGREFHGDLSKQEAKILMKKLYTNFVWTMI